MRALEPARGTQGDRIGRRDRADRLRAVHNPRGPGAKRRGDAYRLPRLRARRPARAGAPGRGAAGCAADRRRREGVPLQPARDRQLRHRSAGRQLPARLVSRLRLRQHRRDPGDHRRARRARPVARRDRRPRRLRSDRAGAHRRGQEPDREIEPRSAGGKRKARAARNDAGRARRPVRRGLRRQARLPPPDLPRPLRRRHPDLPRPQGLRRRQDRLRDRHVRVHRRRPDHARDRHQRPDAPNIDPGSGIRRPKSLLSSTPSTTSTSARTATGCTPATPRTRRSSA